MVLLTQLKNLQRSCLSRTGKARQQASDSYTANVVLTAISPPDGIKEDSDLDCGFV